jgi:hypothetical protein
MTWVIVGGVVVLLVVAALDALLTSESGTPASATTTEIEARLSAEQEIELTGNKWAPLFAAHRRMCNTYMTQPACEWAACERPSEGRIQNCTPLSLEFRRSFAGAVVEEVVIKGAQAAATFSNGATVQFTEIGGSGDWWIHRVGGNAGP